MAHLRAAYLKTYEAREGESNRHANVNRDVLRLIKDQAHLCLMESSIDRRSFLAAGLGLAASPAVGQVSARTCYSMSFKGLDGGDIRLADFAGKPIMVVNTASLCGYTPQFTGLQALWTRFSPLGFTLIGVPSNDFGGQEPGGPQEIRATAETFGVRFPIAAKEAVVGPQAHPFYRWAAGERPRDLPRWNFHKYLVGRDGHIAAVFPTGIEPGDPQVASAIEREFRSSAAG